MADATLVCMSHGRAGEVKAFGTFGPDLLLSVAESQVDAYRYAYPEGRLDPHPDEIVGLPAKKNYLYAKFGDVFLVDDDIGQMIDHATSTKVEPVKAVQLVHRLADMAEQMGTYLYGFTSDVNPMLYKPQRPYALTGMLDGGKFGLLKGSRLWWPEDPIYGMCEDIWITALNAYENRRCLRELRYAIPGQVGQVGGLGNVRTTKTMQANADLLKRSFGDAIVFKDQRDAQLYYWRFRGQW